MNQLLQSYRTGELWLADVPAPACGSRGAVVRTGFSVVSAGTEKMIIELARKSLISKARARPDLVRKVINKIKSQGISQTLEQVFSKLDTPIPLGYSCAGTVVEAGSECALRVGQRVACAGAGYATHAEFNFVPQNLCVALPENVSLEDASFTTLGAIAMQGVRQADVRIGESVAVIGLGLLGLLTVQILKAAGCRVIGFDPDTSRCKLAIELGGDLAVSENVVDSATAFSSGYGVDCAIITAATTSNQPIEDAAQICRTKGRVVIVGMVGMSVPRDPFYKKELELRLSMSYGPGRYDPSYEEGGRDYPYGYVRWTEQRNMQSFVDLLASGKVTPQKLISHRFEISAALGAYELIESSRQSYLGVVISYPAGTITRAPARTVTLAGARLDVAPGIGFIGAGNFAKSVLMPALKRHGQLNLVGLCARTGHTASETARKHGFGYATTDQQKILSDPNVHAVFVATRHDSHCAITCAALQAGKHVFVEKPLCVSEEQIDQLRQTIEGLPEPRILTVGFNRRFSQHARAVRDAFAGRTGPMLINYRVHPGQLPAGSWLHDPQAGGGRIVGEVCHFVDLCEFLTGSVPTRVHAHSAHSHDNRVPDEDNVSISISYRDGSLATILYLASAATDLGKERIEVSSGGASAVIEDFSRTTFHGLSRGSIKGKQDKGFDEEIRSFLGAIRGGRDAPILFESLVRTTQLTFAIRRSIRESAPQDLGRVATEA